MNELDISQVTRLEVIDENGRSYTKHQISNIEFSLQDDARTLKIFLEVDQQQKMPLTRESFLKLVDSLTDEKVAALVEALEYHQEQTRPIQKTIDALAKARRE